MVRTSGLMICMSMPQQQLRHTVPIGFKIRMDLTLWMLITSNLCTLVYQGGDNCIAVKPRSYNIFVQIVTLPPLIEEPQSWHDLRSHVMAAAALLLAALVNTSKTPPWSTFLSKTPTSLPIIKTWKQQPTSKTWVGHLVPQPTSYESDNQPHRGGWSVSSLLTLHDTFTNYLEQGRSAKHPLRELLHPRVQHRPLNHTRQRQQRLLLRDLVDGNL
jgi:hypothetical protein